MSKLTQASKGQACIRCGAPDAYGLKFHITLFDILPTAKAGGGCQQIGRGENKLNIADYKNIVAEQGCIICGNQAQLHHPRFSCGMSQRSNDWLVIPLCPDHHQHGGYGVAIHAGQSTFEQNYGTEAELLAKTIKKIMAWY